MAELILIVGQVGAGKTTHAKQLAVQSGAVRFTPDEWMVPLFRHNDADGMRDVVEGRLIWTAVEVLRADASAILDFGLWSRAERASLGWLAARAGASARTVYLPVDRETQAARVAKRWRETPEQTWDITQADLDTYRGQFQPPDADELTGTYAAQPPDGADWAEWTARRWPTSLGAASGGRDQSVSSR